MCHKIVIIGAGGHSKVIADIVLKNNYNLLGFIDDNVELGTCIFKTENTKYTVIGKVQDCLQLLKNDKEIKFIIGIGNNYIREEISKKYILPYITLIHPSANISFDVSIGEGTVIMANACINANAKIGNHCIINTGSIIEHDNVLDDFVHISPNATLCGIVQIGKYSHIGAGVTVKNNISITQKCIIGAGAVVVRNIEQEGTYIGVPANLI